MIARKIALFAMIACVAGISDASKSQVYSKTPTGYTEYMDSYPGDSVVWVSDDSGKHYFYDYEYSPPKLVRGLGKVKRLPQGVVSIDGDYVCKTSDLQHLKANGRLYASCTSSGWRKK